MGKRGRKVAPWFGAFMTGLAFLTGGPTGAIAVASAAITGYRLGKKNASAKEVVGTIALSALTFGASKVAAVTQPVWLETIKKE
jgi:hypothetical protein